MKPRLLPAFLSLLGLSLAAQAPVLEALAKGKVTLELRTRYEHVDDDAFKAPADHLTANALTNRTILGLETGEWEGVKATLQFLNVTALGEERYNSGLNGRAQFASIKDPGLSEVLQAYVSWKGLKVGRQMLAVDNQRFIGAGAWAQAPKAFTGATLQQKFGLSWMELHAGHLIRVLDSVGTNKDLRLDFARVRFTPWAFLAVTPFWYGLNDEAAPAVSLQHRGLRADGKWKGILYEASYAQQRGYKESKTTKDCNYRQLALGYAFPAVSLKAVHEELEGGFNTPQASLHGFYGWSDRVAATPATGLVDEFLQAEAKLAGVAFELQFHRFKAQSTSQAYGKELDFSATYPLTKKFSVMLKAARYQADSEAPTSLVKDLNKLWLMTTFKF